MSSHDDDMPLYSVIAEKLLALGWRSDCDAQHTNLRDALPELRTLLSPVERDGGPAFPPVHDPVNHPSGMTLRDYFAAKAMHGDIASLPEAHDWAQHTDSIASRAYAMADAMLKARAA